MRGSIEMLMMVMFCLIHRPSISSLLDVLDGACRDGYVRYADESSEAYESVPLRFGAPHPLVGEVRRDGPLRFKRAAS